MSEPFDFEAFISGAKPATDTFDIYLVNNSRAIARLEAQIEQAGDSGDERESSVPADVTALRQQVDALKAEMHASKREVTLRSLEPDEWDAQLGADTDVYDQLATQSVSPVLDHDQWQRLGAAMGAAQFSEFMKKANELAGARVVVPDFSQPSSTSQDLRESSLS